MACRQFQLSRTRAPAPAKPQPQHQPQSQHLLLVLTLPESRSPAALELRPSGTTVTLHQALYTWATGQQGQYNSSATVPVE